MPNAPGYPDRRARIGTTSAGSYPASSAAIPAATCSAGRGDSTAGCEYRRVAAAQRWPSAPPTPPPQVFFAM